MNKEEIMEILPHRKSMLILDEVEENKGTAIGSKYITGKEWFLDGHFPQNPIVPGVILCEIIAQSSCILLKDTFNGNGDKVPVLTGMNNVRFLKPVRPGDLFKTDCKILRKKHPFYFAEGKGYVEDELCVKAEFSFRIVEEQ